MNLKKLVILLCLGSCGVSGIIQAQNQAPIHFHGSYIVFKQDTILLHSKSLLVDGQLSDSLADSYPNVYNSIQEAADHLVPGTEEEPMDVHIAPWVYWIDDPDNPNIRIPDPGDPVPYGLKIKCPWLFFHGLTSDPTQVVLACNRGQTIGAQGNFTMFKLSGDGIRAENLTFGNYCNVDLNYSLKPELSRPKRASAIVQAQLIHCDGDKILARNVHFLSRLNLCPFVGGKRTLFDHCHFECTDDALSATAVYLNSTFEFYSSKPFYHTRGTGAIFLNCDIRSYTKEKQFFTKAAGQLAVIDTRFETDSTLSIEWKDIPLPDLINYQYNVWQNGEPVMINQSAPQHTVDLTNAPLLMAYKIRDKEQTIYNTYNLLRGEDDWDPMGIKSEIKRVEQQTNLNLDEIPVQLKISQDQTVLETGKDTAFLVAKTYRFGGFENALENIIWTLDKDYEDYAEIIPESGKSLKCHVIPNNQTDLPKRIIVKARSENGLRAASTIDIYPKILPPPHLSSEVIIRREEPGSLKLLYTMDTNYPDVSNISWFRCADLSCVESWEVAISQPELPLSVYRLVEGDIGYYLMAIIEPKHLRSHAGEPVKIIFPDRMTSKQVKDVKSVLHPDLSKLSAKYQPMVRPGFWTIRHTLDDAPISSNNIWWYGEGKDGGSGIKGLIQGRKGFLGYTPIKTSKKNMKMEVQVAPFKTAGQGFSIAPLHMDLLIKFDFKSLTGYGLRIMRTTKYGNAVDFVFVEYEDGQVREISERVSTSCYRSICSISVEFKDDQLIAHASTSSDYDQITYGAEIVPEIQMHQKVSDNRMESAGIWYNGGASAVIRDLIIQW